MAIQGSTVYPIQLDAHLNVSREKTLVSDSGFNERNAQYEGNVLLPFKKKTYEWKSGDSLRVITDADGKVWEYGMDAAGDLQLLSPDNDTFTFENNQVRISDPQYELTLAASVIEIDGAVVPYRIAQIGNAFCVMAEGLEQRAYFRLPENETVTTWFAHKNLFVFATDEKWWRGYITYNSATMALEVNISVATSKTFAFSEATHTDNYVVAAADVAVGDDVAYIVSFTNAALAPDNTAHTELYAMRWDTTAGTGAFVDYSAVKVTVYTNNTSGGVDETVYTAGAANENGATTPSAVAHFYDGDYLVNTFAVNHYGYGTSTDTRTYIAAQRFDGASVANDNITLVCAGEDGKIASTLRHSPFAQDDPKRTAYPDGLTYDGFMYRHLCAYRKDNDEKKYFAMFEQERIVYNAGYNIKDGVMFNGLGGRVNVGGVNVLYNEGVVNGLGAGRKNKTSSGGNAGFELVAEGIYSSAPTYANGRWVACEANCIMGSADGINWTKVYDSPDHVFFSAAVYGDGVWVAARYGNPILLYSLDGITWFECSMPDVEADTSFGYTASPLYAKGLWVACLGINQANGKNVFTSRDGINWTGIPNSPKSDTSPVYVAASINIGSYIFNGVYLVARPAPLGFFFSFDGLNWDTVKHSSGGNAVRNGIGVGNGLACYMSTSSFLSNSGDEYYGFLFDVKEWNSVDVIINNNTLDNIGTPYFVPPSSFVGTFCDFDSNLNFVGKGAWIGEYTGTSVVLRDIPVNALPNCIRIGGGRWVACEATRIMGSADGNTWSEVYNSGSATAVYKNSALTYINGMWFALRLDGGVDVSIDGITWTHHPSTVKFLGYQTNCVVVADGVVMAAGQGGIIRMSLDSIFSTLRVGNLATEWGGISKLFGVQKNGLETLAMYLDTENAFRTLRLTQEATTAPDIFRFGNYLCIRTAAGYNAVNTRTMQLVNWCSDFNNAVFLPLPNSHFTNDSEPKYLPVASAQNADFTDALMPSMQRNPSGLLYALGDGTAETAEFRQGNLSYATASENIDVYGGGTELNSAPYLFTITKAGFIESAAKRGTTAPVTTGGNVFNNMPLTAEIINSNANRDYLKLGSSVYELAKRDNTELLGGYYLLTLVANVTASFVLQSQPYFISGDYIFEQYSSGGINQGASAVADVRGLEYCGALTDVAFFLARQEMKLYAFYGDRTLQEFMAFDSVENFYGAYWNAGGQEIFLNTNKGYYVLKRGRESVYMYHIDTLEDFDIPENVYVQFTQDGVIFDDVRERKAHTLTLFGAGGAVVPIVLETRYFGAGLDNVGTVDCFFIRLFTGGEGRTREGIVTLSAKTLTDVGTKVTTKQINVTADDWDAETDTYFLRFQPQYQSSLGTSLRIESPFPIQSINVSFTVKGITQVAHNNR